MADPLTGGAVSAGVIATGDDHLVGPVLPVLSGMTVAVAAALITSRPPLPR